MQSVNFYLEEYRPKPLSFDNRFAVLVLIVFILLFVALGLYHNSRQSDLKQRLVSKQQEFNQLQQEVSLLQKKLSDANQKESLDLLIASRQQGLNSYRKILAKMKLPENADSLKYSQILKQLSEQKARDIWLTKISIQKQNLSIQGRSLDTKAIPEYVDDLKNADSLKRYFDELKVERDPENQQLVNFSLLNGRIKQ